KEDIPLLAQHFLNIFSGKNHKTINGFTPKAIDHLIQYDWPGNVRELMNLIERGVVLSQSNYLDEIDLPLITKPSPEKSDRNLAGTVEEVSLDQVEKNTILKTLEQEDGNKSAAARKLGITRKTLHKKLKKYGVMP
ncbi:MAG: two-component system response regulator, partial [Desulfobacterales bacterium]|nr:two-component system response regulator [Desulfobacterales bacterium]